MATIVSGLEIGADVCIALGLNPKCIRSLHILIEPDDVVRIETTYYPSEDQLKKGISLIRKDYRLIQIEEVEPTQFKTSEFQMWRILHGFSLRDVAKETGLSISTISRIENNKGKPLHSSVELLYNFYKWKEQGDIKSK